MEECGSSIEAHFSPLHPCNHIFGYSVIPLRIYSKPLQNIYMHSDVRLSDQVHHFTCHVIPFVIYKFCF